MFTVDLEIFTDLAFLVGRLEGTTSSSDPSRLTSHLLHLSPLLSKTHTDTLRASVYSIVLAQMVRVSAGAKHEHSTESEHWTNSGELGREF